MTLELSISDRNAALEAVATNHADHVIRVYDDSGTTPASPSDAIDGASVLLGTFTESDDGSTGLNMEATAANGVLVKDTGEVWKSTLVASGTPAFYRYSALSDTGGSSTTEPRVQGTVGLVNADLLVSSLSWVSGDEKTIDSYAWGQPEEAS